MKEYNKLVRDKIPEIIEKSGAKAITRTLTDEEYKVFLEKKLDEEVAEFHESKRLDEIVDILEVIYALNQVYGFSGYDIVLRRETKFRNRGGFEQKILLVGVEEAGGKNGLD